MGVEIERKYLVKDSSYKAIAKCKSHIVQGYLCREPERTVRVRIRDSKGYITIKGLNHGMMRLEFEYEIPKYDAEEILGLCNGKILDKTRYIVEYGGFEWEIDEFNNLNDNLVVAEVELPSVNSTVSLPPFIGEEVTGNPKYYNSML